MIDITALRVKEKRNLSIILFSLIILVLSSHNTSVQCLTDIGIANLKFS